MTAEASELRYLDLKKNLCYQIYKGVYADGEKIPSERQLALDYNVSRITVRKALELLEEDDLIRREVGNGTLVQLRNRGNETALDTVALVATSKNPFFASFIAEFQKTAWENDTLLLYVEVPEKTGIEDCLYQLYQKDIRNAVVWPDDQTVDKAKLLRLRSIGMNLVFFDTDDAYPYADCAFLDNEDAVRRLVQEHAGEGENCLYVGWDKLSIRSVKKREETFRKLCPDGVVLRIPWRRDRQVAESDAAKIKEAISVIESGMVLCTTGELGRCAAQMIQELEMQDKVTLSIIDDFDETGHYPVAVCQQDLGQTAEKIYERLENQIEKNREWKAAKCAIKGVYFVRNEK